MREEGREGDTISLLMEEKFLQIAPVKYLQLPPFDQRETETGRRGERT